MKILNQKKKDEILDYLKSGMKVLPACAKSGHSHDWWYKHKKADPDFNEQWEAALVQGAKTRLEEMEDVADHRAMKGHLVNVRKVEQDGKIRMVPVYEFSDTLLIFRMKAEAERARDTSYRQRQDHTSGDDKLQAGLIAVPTPAESKDEWEKQFGAMKHPDGSG